MVVINVNRVLLFVPEAEEDQQIWGRVEGPQQSPSWRSAPCKAAAPAVSGGAEDM